MNIDIKIVDILILYDGHIGQWQDTVAILDSMLHRDFDRAAFYIQFGPEICHCGALMYLRYECGYEAWGFTSDGGNSLNYKYRKYPDSEWVIIVPINKRNIKEEFDQLDIAQ